MKSLSFFARLIALVAATHASMAATYYVAPTGSDTDSPAAGAEATPFATLAYAASRVSPGDEILLLPGTYQNATYGQLPLDVWKTGETVRINGLNGTSSAWITIKPQTPGTVLMRGDAVGIFTLRNSSYVRIEGLHIEGEVERIPLSLAFEYQFQYKDADGVIQWRINPPGQTPLTIAEIEAINDLPAPIVATRPSYFGTVGLLLQSCTNVEVRGCLIHHCPGVGLRFQGCDLFKCIGNEVHNCSRRGAIGNHGLVVHSLASSNDGNTGYRVEITGNVVRDNYNEVYSWSELKTFITPHIDEGKGISMQKNFTGWNIDRVLIANNVCYGNGFSGIHANECRRMDFIHNTCFNNQRSGSGPNTGISAQDSNDITIRNNISVADNTFAGRAISVGTSSGMVIADNLIVGTLNADADGIDTGTVVADPMLINASANNFRLNAASPAIGAANPAFTLTTDFAGTTRDAAPDFGALEYLPGNDDSDSDGLPDILEHGFGTSLTTRNANPATPSLQTVAGGQRLRVTVPRAPATGVTLSVEVSGDLLTWSTADTVIETDTPTALTVHDTFSISTGTKRFMRVRATRP